MKIPFSPPDITEEEIEQVSEALRSGWITTGPKTKELEREVAPTQERKEKYEKNIKKDFNNFADLHYDFISSSSPSQNARIFWR